MSSPKKKTAAKRYRRIGAPLPALTGTSAMAGRSKPRRMGAVSANKKNVKSALYGLAGTIAGIVATEMIMPHLPGTRQTKQLATAAIGIGMIVISKGKNPAFVGLGTGMATTAAIGMIKSSGMQQSMQKVVSGIMAPMVPGVYNDAVADGVPMPGSSISAPITKEDIDQYLIYGLPPTMFS